MADGAVGRRRIVAAQAALEASGFDGLLLINSLNLVYLAGYQSTVLTLARPFYLVVPARGEPILLVHRTRPWEARRHSWLREVRTYDPLSVAPVPELRAVLDEMGLLGRRIGAELGFEQRMGLPVFEWERLRVELGPTRFEDAARLIWELRAIKGPEEIEHLRLAGRITATAYTRLFASIRPGQSDFEVVRRLKSEMMAGGATATWAMVSGGAGQYDLGVGLGTGSAYEPGDMVWLDAGCSVGGYWSDFSRAAVLGPASPEQREAHAWIRTITAEGVAMCRPGVPLAEIAAHCNQRVSAAGLPVTIPLSELAGRIGHGIGLDATEPPHVSETDGTILAPGMVVSIEPGVATDHGVFHIEENVLVTPDGPEILSVAPSHLTSVPL